MAIRNGKQFIQGLRDRPRNVFIQGEKVTDVATHPAFQASVEHIAHLYDMQSDPAHGDKLTYVAEDTGQRAGMAFKPATSMADLQARRAAYRLWAEENFGLMGRSPDFMNVSLLAFWETRDLLDRNGQKFSQNMDQYYRRIRDEDLFLSHALVPPQNDRSKASHELGDLHMRVVRETDSGIYISGARMIATLGPVADEMLIYSLPGLRPGDEDHALAFSINCDAPGLRQICREPYTLAGTRSSFDHPLSTRFEENDSLLIFDNVFVPWERVYIYRDVALANALYSESALRNHTAHQTNTRALVKLEFSAGIALALARSIKADQFLHVQEMLGEALSMVEMVKSGLVHSEVACETTSVGTVRPSLAPLQTLRTFLPRAYPRMVEFIQKIAAGSFMMMPTAADFHVPEIEEDMKRYYLGAGMESMDRVRLVKLAWDLVGEGFGQRALQYERYYAGDPVRTMASNTFSLPSADPDRLVRKALELAGTPEVTMAPAKAVAAA